MAKKLKYRKFYFCNVKSIWVAACATENINLFPTNVKYYYFKAPSLQNVKNVIIHILGVLPVGDLAKDSDVLFLIQGLCCKDLPQRSIYKPQCISSSQKILPDLHALPFRYSQFPSFFARHTTDWGSFGFKVQRCTSHKESEWLQRHLVLHALKSLSQWKGWPLPAFAFGFCFAAYLGSGKTRQAALPLSCNVNLWGYLLCFLT